MRQRGFQPGDAVEAIDDSSTAFLDALRTRAMDELHESAAEYGLQLQDLAVLDREFRGETARTLDSLTIRALQAQVEVCLFPSWLCSTVQQGQVRETEGLHS